MSIHVKSISKMNKLLQIKGKWIIKCDVCNEIIEGDGTANIEIAQEEEGKVYFVHKKCETGFNNQEHGFCTWTNYEGILIFSGERIPVTKLGLAVLWSVSILRDVFLEGKNIPKKYQDKLIAIMNKLSVIACRI